MKSVHLTHDEYSRSLDWYKHYMIAEFEGRPLSLNPHNPIQDIETIIDHLEFSGFAPQPYRGFQS